MSKGLGKMQRLIVDELRNTGSAPTSHTTGNAKRMVARARPWPRAEKRSMPQAIETIDKSWVLPRAFSEGGGIAPPLRVHLVEILFSSLPPPNGKPRERKHHVEKFKII
jgi:hypothetical protein